MKSSSYRRQAEAAQNQFSDLLELPSNTIQDLLPSKRGEALWQYQNRPKGVSPDDAAARLAAALGLDASTDTQDILVAAELQTRAMQRILDPSALKSLDALSIVWAAPPERLISEGLKLLSALKPDLRFSDSEIAL